MRTQAFRIATMKMMPQWTSSRGGLLTAAGGDEGDHGAVREAHRRCRRGVVVCGAFYRDHEDEGEASPGVHQCSVLVLGEVWGLEEV